MSKHLAFVVAVAALGLGACATKQTRPAGAVTAEQQFERIKALAGAWEATPTSEMKGRVTYRLVGGGSTVEETLFPGAPHEMVTMYHLDGRDLVLTHYCAAGNQPTMRALPSKDLGEIRWQFVRLSNGDASKDMHMHEAVMTFADANHFRAHWSGWTGGKPGGHEAKLELVRAAW